ncbi:hypothetical protein [Vibrio penaeicida]|uniref:hypothetical protein n=1 Tax=Vibrio penaeicida TaxID=104609 RepID=UPI000CEA1BBD|nr:hypothetical protein [Vibrio penaeicida]
MLKNKQLSIALFVLSLCLPTFSSQAHDATTVYGFEALLLGSIQVLLALVISLSDYSVGLLLVIPWLANITWFMSLVMSKSKNRLILSVISTLFVALFFIQPITMIGEAGSSIDLQLLIGAYIWGLSLIVPILGELMKVRSN